MGAHRGPIRVYGAPWLRWLAPLLQPATTFWLWLITLGALAIGKVLYRARIRRTGCELAFDRTEA
jgi:hypothetical protein